MNKEISELLFLKKQLDEKIKIFKINQLSEIESVLKSIQNLISCEIQINRYSVKLSKINNSEITWFLNKGLNKEKNRILSTNEKQQLIEVNIKEQEVNKLIDSLLSIIDLNSEVSSLINQPALDFDTYIFNKKGLQLK